MPYRIKAKNAAGSTVTRMDQNKGVTIVTDKAIAEELAVGFAATRGHGGPWTGFVEYYDASQSIAAIVKKTPADRAKPKLKSGNAWVD